VTRAEREERILSLAPLVRRLACSRLETLPYRSRHLRDDMESAGWLGAIDAVDRYDPARNVPLAAFAAWRISGAIGDYLRELDPVSRDARAKLRADPNARPPYTFSIDAMRDGLVFEFGDKRSLAAFATVEARLDVASLCKATRAKIKPRSLRIVKSFARGETMKDIGRREGCKESRVSQICKRTHLLLRQAA
jgi:RNA polymerase sigma factor (sigma-70 family)